MESGGGAKMHTGRVEQVGSQPSKQALKVAVVKVSY